MEYVAHIVVLCAIYAILSVSLNLVVGYTGLVSLAHAAFYGIGAYAAALSLLRFDIGFVPALAVGAVCSALASVCIGVVLSRFKSDYYMLVSLGFTAIITGILVNWTSVTGGPIGIAAIPRPIIFGIQIAGLYAFVVLSGLVCTFVVALSWWIGHSAFGRVLQAIREDEEVVQMAGFATEKYKLAVFVASAMCASLAGGLYAAYVSFVDPTTFRLNESIVILAMVILGGLGRTRGAFLGACVLVVLPEMLRFTGFPASMAGYLRQLSYGLILIFLMMYRPQGFLGAFRL